MIKHVTEKETQLSNMLHTCSETLKQVTAERDKLAGELKALRDSGVELPEPNTLYLIGNSGYTEDDLRDYGDRRAMAATLKERERCERVCATRKAQSRNHLVRSGITVVELDIHEGEK